MTLNVLDERGQTVTENNPIIVEHNGTIGDSVTLPLTLVNDSSTHYYRNINLRVNSVYPVNASLLIQGEVVPNYLREKEVRRLNPKGKVLFNLNTFIPPNTPEQVVRGVTLGITGMRYPVS